MDVAVGGNVESGMGYLETALKETKEELGLDIREEYLIEIEKKQRKHYDKITWLEGNSMDIVYALRFNGNLEDLNFQKEEITGLEWWPIDKLFNLTAEEKELFVPITISDEILKCVKQVKKLI